MLSASDVVLFALVILSRNGLRTEQTFCASYFNNILLKKMYLKYAEILERFNTTCHPVQNYIARHPFVVYTNVKNKYIYILPSSKSCTL